MASFIAIWLELELHNQKQWLAQHIEGDNTKCNHIACGADKKQIQACLRLFLPTQKADTRPRSWAQYFQSKVGIKMHILF